MNIFDPNYKWPSWTIQAVWTVIYFLGGYAGAMELAKEPLFSWTAVAAGISAVIVYNHGVYTPSSNGK